MSTPSPECVRTNEHLLDYAYGELQGAPLEDVERHLPGCSRCQLDLAALRSTRRVMSRLEPEPPPQAGLESLLAYAEQQAARQRAVPKRPRWVGWLFALVPTAAVATVALVLATSTPQRASPALNASEEAPGSVASPVAEAAPAMPETVAATGAPAKKELAEGKPSANGPVSLGRASSAADLEGAATGAREKVEAAKPVATAAPELKKAVASKQKAVEKFDKRDAPRGDGRVAMDEGKGRAADDDKLAPPPAPAAAPMEVAAENDGAKAEVDAKAEVEESAKLSQPSRQPSLGMAGGAASAAGAVAQTAPAPKPSRVTAAPSPAAAAPAPASAPASAAVADRVLDLADSSMERKDSRSETRTIDAWSEAERARRSGKHAEAARLYRAIYQAGPHAPRAAEALFSAALEAQAGGLLAQAAHDFEQVAREFPQARQAPTALARAAEILRSSEGEGAATSVETDLLERYPDSPEAHGLARHERAEPSRRAAKKAAAPDLEAPAASAPAAEPAVKR